MRAGDALPSLGGAGNGFFRDGRVHEDAPVGRSKGAIAVLALLLSVLVSAVDAPAGRAGAGAFPAAVGHNDAVKGGALLRTGGRHSDDERDRTGPLLLRRGGAIETAVVARRAGAGLLAAPAAPFASFPSLSYRARAPPADA